MTDQEYIDYLKSLDRQAAELDAKENRIECIPTDGKTPPLFLMPDRKLSAAAIENLRNSLKASYGQGAIVVIEPGITVYQLVNGKWELMPSRASDS